MPKDMQFARRMQIYSPVNVQVLQGPPISKVMMHFTVQPYAHAPGPLSLGKTGSTVSWHYEPYHD